MKELSFNIDRNLRIALWDQGIAQYTGTSARRALGKKYFEVFPRIMIDQRDAVSEVFKKKKALVLKGYRFQCPCGHISASIKLAPCKSANGISGATHVKVAMRPVTACFVEKRLDRSQKFIEIGKIASTLAHGVKNPLNAIKGAVVYLRGRYSHEEQLQEFTQIMEAEISKLENFITRFLGSAATPGETSLVDINALISKIKVFISLQTYAHNIQCEYKLGKIPPIVANPFHIDQALLSVINNAIEAMKSGGTLAIRTFTEEKKEGTFIVIEVTDTGPGMKEGIFEDKRGDKTPGRGFGLFIAYEMVKYYKGRLEIQGEKGKGTKARFYLPVQGDGTNGGAT
ncbi:MAG TPA: ATP-binding protein [Candidatus Sulfobium mesophilum]|nr:ATP-binding protein [Candidatus Sulfobium mesophilum]